MTKQLCIAVSGLHRGDNPQPGPAVIRSIRRRYPSARIIGLSYDPLESGLFSKSDDGVDAAFLMPFPGKGPEALIERLDEICETYPLDMVIPCLDSEIPNYIELADEFKARGIKSPLLDAIARAPIWASGVEYSHGTGHGVGYFLNVHEGPQVISYYAPPDAHTAMEPGMITSIEPGIYRPGQWGIRIENLVMNQAAGKTEFGDFLSFETLTLCPIDTRCIDLTLLREDERAWLNAYHETVRARVSPHVEGAARAWLDARTKAI